MISFALLSLFWIICGVIAFGLDVAYTLRKWPNLDYTWKDYLKSMVLVPTGLTYLLAVIITIPTLEYGWTVRPFREQRIRKVEAILDGHNDFNLSSVRVSKRR